MEKTLQKVKEFILSKHLRMSAINGRRKKMFEELNQLIPGIMVIFDYDKLKPVFFNEKAKLLLGIKDEGSKYSFSSFFNVLHPDSFLAVQHNFSFLKDNPDTVFKTSLAVKSAATNGYTWLYCTSQLVYIKDKSLTRLVCLIAAEIEDILHLNELQNEPVVKNSVEGLNTTVKFSKREQEVIKLMCEELTTKEIAGRLLYSVATVEADRKNIIRKLGVKSMVGVVKYALNAKVVRR